MSKKNKKKAKTVRASDRLMKAYIGSYGYSIYETKPRTRALEYHTVDDVTGAYVAFQANLSKNGLINSFVYANLGLDLESSQDDLGIRVSVYDPVDFLNDLAPVISARPVVTQSNVQDFAYVIDGLSGVSFGPTSTFVTIGGGLYTASA
jgi:hypothetical protein